LSFRSSPKDDASRPLASSSRVAAADHEHRVQVGRLSFSGFRARLVRGVGWNLVATAFTQGGTFALNLIFANLWGVRAFGQYAIVQSTLTTLTSVANSTLGLSATRYTAELRAGNPIRAGRVLGLCGAIAVAMALLAAGGLTLGSRAIAERFLHAPGLTIVLVIASAIVFFNIMSTFLSGSLAGLEGFPALGRAGMVTGVLSVGIAAVSGWMWGLTGAVAGLAVSACLQTCILYVTFEREASRQAIRVTLSESSKELPILFGFVAPAALNSLAAFPAIWLANTFLVQQQNGYQQMALFAAASSFRILVLLVPTIVNNVSLSLLNNQLGAAQERRYRRMFWTNLAVNAGLVTLGAGAVILLGPRLLRLFGNDFTEGYAVLVVLMLATLPETLATATTQIVQSRERMWLSFWGIVLPTYSVLIALAYVLTPAHGARGLAWSYVAAMTIALVGAVSVVGRLGVWDRDPAEGQGPAA